ncbi:hypothetical protein L2E82_48001 [Cichorium intybus]|uniref:Uncharacterized protein n=1 Tax=Cichorium intybus TaxID=13427 RepID=A0ACB8YXK8_CICIN|nr:hypothetical protein L2E82_48001 [Cichorium intybus]
MTKTRIREIVTLIRNKILEIGFSFGASPIVGSTEKKQQSAVRYIYISLTFTFSNFPLHRLSFPRGVPKSQIR